MRSYPDTPSRPQICGRIIEAAILRLRHYVIELSTWPQICGRINAAKYILNIKVVKYNFL